MIESSTQKHCCICGESTPSHVRVYVDPVTVGRVCGSHPIAEVQLAVLPDNKRLQVSVEMYDEDDV